MAASLVSSIIFFLLCTILSLLVDGNVFAAQIEHPNLEETMTMRRNLEGNGARSSKIHFGGSRSRKAGGKTANVPVQNQPQQVTAHAITGYVYATNSSSKWQPRG
ncbi:hypothetical protein CARUB_v10021193mg [Capsella rubella]|uniref:Uncharacterized protein n=1 Tax=Capsella rubella TaxID=81985 RepID=R0ICN7_9BRAS|nr:uncharacterized protein LOC17894304 [Capsella rubella]EOA35935.1 hypothetical protein CARUB_v10021193mg [Capsella rubella]